MSEITPTHVPSAEFRAMLAAEVVRTFQREAQFTPDRRWFNPRHARGFLILIAGLVMGFTTEFASGQVQDAQERGRLLEAAAETRQLAAMRLQLAEEALRDARDRYNAGVMTREALLAAEAEARDRRIHVMRIELEMAEIRETAAPPRDDLAAPRVGSRDFVSERLRLEAAMYQDRLNAAEQRLQDVERATRVGAATAAALGDAQGDVEGSRAALELAGMKLQLRKQFLEEGLTADEVTRRAQRTELMIEFRRLEQALRRAMERETLSRDRARAGAASELEAKRAEVEVLELQLHLKSLQQQLRQLEAVRKEP
ncbi:MAG TPA: hypothetical protein VLE53_08520 [Gemmatimonadaceae bacterium]|nr:hypothetical protein [Gemmatimonadaceae bacterium]